MTKRKRKWNRPIRGLFTYASGGPVWRVYFGSFIGRILSGAFFLSTIYESMKTDVLRPRPTIRRRPRFHGCFSALDVVTNRTACFFFCFFPATVDIVRTKSPKREATDKKKTWPTCRFRRRRTEQRKTSTVGCEMAPNHRKWQP